MKTLKVTKKMLKMHPADLLVKLGAVDIEKKFAYPQHVYFSKEDGKKLKKNLKELAKKSFPGIASKKLDYSVGMEWLNYGPNENLADAIRPGYMLVDYEEIEATEKARKGFDELLPKNKV